MRDRYVIVSFYDMNFLTENDYLLELSLNKFVNV